MQDSDVSEVFHLFNIMQKYGARCSLEWKADGALDPILGLSEQPIELVEFFERNGGPDSLLLELGEVSFNFELGVNVFMKDISDVQILICIASDHYDIWFDSTEIPSEGITEARSYMERRLREKQDVRDIEMTVTKQEKELIEFVRTLCFEDLLDATSGIYSEEEQTKVRALKCKEEGKYYNAEGFKERAENLNKLAGLLADANKDYREHTSCE